MSSNIVPRSCFVHIDIFFLAYYEREIAMVDPITRIWFKISTFERLSIIQR